MIVQKVNQVIKNVILLLNLNVITLETLIEFSEKLRI